MYDAVIVGARCAGAALAIFLGQRGYRVALVDKDTFPSHTTSTHVTGEVEIYRRLGVLDELETAGAPPLRRMHVHLGSSSFESDMLITSRAIGLRRYYFDSILIRKALSYPGSLLREGCRVTGLIMKEGQVQGVQIKAGDQEEEIRAKVVIGADGYHSFVAGAVNAEVYETTDKMRPAYYSYFKYVKPLPIPAVEWFWTGNDIVFCNPTDSGLHSVLVMPPLSEVRHWVKNPTRMLLDRTSSIPGLDERMQDAELADRVRGIGPRPMFLKRAFGSGWALVGDAGAYVHPVTGSGMDNAIACAEWLAEAMTEFFRGNAPWEEVMEAYQCKRDDFVKPQMYGAQVSMDRADEPISEEALQWVRAVCTFPGLTYDLGRKIKEVTGVLGPERVEQLTRLLQPLEQG